MSGGAAQALDDMLPTAIAKTADSSTVTNVQGGRTPPEQVGILNIGYSFIIDENK